MFGDHLYGRRGRKTEASAFADWRRSAAGPHHRRSGRRSAAFTAEEMPDNEAVRAALIAMQNARFARDGAVYRGFLGKFPRCVLAHSRASSPNMAQRIFRPCRRTARFAWERALGGWPRQFQAGGSDWGLSCAGN